MKRSLQIVCLFFALAVVPHAAGEPLVTEFLAINATGLRDDDGDREDWIEITNMSPNASASLAGYFLTCDPGQPARWAFPDMSVPPMERIVVFASGKDRRDPAAPLHTNFKLNGDGEYLALMRNAGAITVQAFVPDYPAQRADVSYGLTENGTFDYLQETTPAEENAEAALGFLPPPLLSVPRGFYETPFRLELASTAPEARIVYTTDGSPPTALSAVYEVPLRIDRTLVLRARTLRDGYIPGDVVTTTYVFRREVLTQDAIDPRALSEADPAGQLDAALRALPILSLGADAEAFFGTEGIYTNAVDARGSAFEIPVSVEWIAQEGAAVQTDAGLRMHGGAARTHPKKPLRLHFRADYGARWLDYPLFTDSSVSRFRSLVLRGQGHDAWSAYFGSHPSGTGPDSYATHATYLRDAFVRDIEHRMGMETPHGRFVHLFLNGLYWGVYNLQEHPTAAHYAERLGGDEEDWDVVKAGGEVLAGVARAEISEGTADAWTTLQESAQLSRQSEQLDDSLSFLLDLDRFCDSLISHMWAGDHDWLGPVAFLDFLSPTQSRNWITVRRSRGEVPGPFHFFTWDAEISLGSNLFLFNPKRTLTFDLTTIDHPDSPASIYDALRNIPAFQRRFGDRLQRALQSPDGVLTAERLQARWRSMAESLALPLLAESARWGDSQSPTVLFGPDATWRSEIDWVENVYLMERSHIFLEQCRQAGLYPSVPAPRIQLDLQTLRFDMPLEIDGAIYFTLDGGDPIEGAQLYQMPIPLETDASITARFLSSTGTWSAASQREFLANGAKRPRPGDLAITALLPSPAPPAAQEGQATTAEDFEYLELRNISDDRLRLEGIRFTNGIGFTFASGSLAPGDGLILAANPQAFATRYGDPGFPLMGPYDGRLSNDRDRVRLESGDRETLIDIAYDTQRWPALTGRLLIIPPGTDAIQLGSPDLLPGDPAVLTYAAWQDDLRSRAPSMGLEQLEPTADPDGDGLENLLEYALGADALSLSSLSDHVRMHKVPLPFGSGLVDHLQMTLHLSESITEAVLVWETSRDLRHWSMTRHLELLVEGESNGRRTRWYRDGKPIGADSSPTYWRLRSTLP